MTSASPRCWRRAATQPRSAADLLDVLFKRKLDLHQTTFAMGESIAHVHALQAAGQLAPEPGADGVLRWRTAAMRRRGIDSIDQGASVG